MSVPQKIDHRQIEEQAARWLMRRGEPEWNAGDQAALDGWLSQSMAHKAAYWRLEHGWRQADRIGSLGDAVTPARRPFRESWARRAWQPLAIAASIALVVVAVGSQFRTPAKEGGVEVAHAQTITTTVGARKFVPLDDGSRIELNTATVLRAAVTPESREVWLDQGEAYFEVRHSDRIPFVVHAGPRTITVLGTRFSVRRDGGKVTVSVVEGRVRVEDTKPSPGVRAGSSSIITGGDVAITEGSSTLVAAKSPERVENTLAWRDGMLTFDQVTIGEAAAEFNRYNLRKIVIDDPAVAAIRIGGTFRATNVDAFVRLLHDAYGLQIRIDGNEVRISN